MNPARTLLTAILLASALQPSASAEVVKQTEQGFELRHQLMLAGSPEQAYAALTQVQSWWDSRHTWSGSASNMRMEAAAGGCFCEQLPDGGSVEHLRVVFAKPGKLLRLTGALGPLQQEALAGVMTLSLKPTDGKTELTASYSVGGYSAAGFATWAPAVDGVLKQQFERLQALVARNTSPAKAQDPAQP